MLTIFPAHLLGLKALIGAIEIFLNLNLKLVHLLKDYKLVLPAGVDTKTPSDTNLLIIYFELFLIERFGTLPTLS